MTAGPVADLDDPRHERADRVANCPVTFQHLGGEDKRRRRKPPSSIGGMLARSVVQPYDPTTGNPSTPNARCQPNFMVCAIRKITRTTRFEHNALSTRQDTDKSLLLKTPARVVQPCGRTVTSRGTSGIVRDVRPLAELLVTKSIMATPTVKRIVSHL